MRANKSTRRRLPDHVVTAIETVLEHFWQEQAQDYLSGTREHQATHVFTEMLTVRQWLSTGNLKRRGGVES